MKRTFNGITLERIGNGWATNIGNKTLAVRKSGSCWDAIILKSSKGGSYMDGTKYVYALARANGKTIKEAIAKVME